MQVLYQHIHVPWIGQQDDPQPKVRRHLKHKMTVGMEHWDGHDHRSLADESPQHRFQKPGKALQNAAIAVGVGDHHPLRHTGCPAGESKLAQVNMRIQTDLRRLWIVLIDQLAQLKDSTRQGT